MPKDKPADDEPKTSTMSVNEEGDDKKKKKKKKDNKQSLPLTHYIAQRLGLMGKVHNPDESVVDASITPILRSQDQGDVKDVLNRCQQLSEWLVKQQSKPEHRELEKTADHVIGMMSKLHYTTQSRAAILLIPKILVMVVETSYLRKKIYILQDLIRLIRKIVERLAMIDDLCDELSKDLMMVMHDIEQFFTVQEKKRSIEYGPEEGEDLPYQQVLESAKSQQPSAVEITEQDGEVPIPKSDSNSKVNADTAAKDAEEGDTDDVEKAEADVDKEDKQLDAANEEATPDAKVVPKKKEEVKREKKKKEKKEEKKVEEDEEEENEEEEESSSSEEEDDLRDDKDLKIVFLETELEMKMTWCEIKLKKYELNEDDEVELDEKAAQLHDIAFGNQEKLRGNKFTGQAMHTAGVATRNKADKEIWLREALHCHHMTMDWNNETEKILCVDETELALARFYSGQQATKKGDRFLADLKLRTHGEIGFGEITTYVKILLASLSKRTGDWTRERKIGELKKKMSDSLDRALYIDQPLKTDELYRRLFLAVQYSPYISTSLATRHDRYAESMDFFRYSMRTCLLIPSPEHRATSLQRTWFELVQQTLSSRKLLGSFRGEINSSVLEGVQQVFPLVIDAIESDPELDDETKCRNIAKCYEYYGDLLTSANDCAGAEKVLADGIQKVRNLLPYDHLKRTYVGRLYRKDANASGKLKSASKLKKKMAKALQVFESATDWYNDDEKMREIAESNTLLDERLRSMGAQNSKGFFGFYPACVVFCMNLLSRFIGNFFVLLGLHNLLGRNLLIKWLRRQIQYLVYNTVRSAQNKIVTLSV